VLVCFDVFGVEVIEVFMMWLDMLFGVMFMVLVLEYFLLDLILLDVWFDGVVLVWIGGYSDFVMVVVEYCC